MIGRLNHVAIAVKDLNAAVNVYRKTLGAEVSAAVPQPDHGVTTIFVVLPNTKIELLEPLGANSLAAAPHSLRAAGVIRLEPSAVRSARRPCGGLAASRAGG